MVHVVHLLVEPWPVEKEDVGERPHQQPPVLGAEAQVVDAAVELGELFQLPNGWWPHGARQRHHEVSGGVDELRLEKKAFLSVSLLVKKNKGIIHDVFCIRDG